MLTTWMSGLIRAGKYHALLVRPGTILFRTSQKYIFTCPGASIKGVVIQFCSNKAL